MAVHPERSLHPIRVLHALACVGLGVVFAGYGWWHHPVRFARAPGQRRAAAAGRPSPVPDLAGAMSHGMALVKVVVPDALGGLGVLLLFTLGTGVYARRFEVWLEAHQAGEAAALRGVGLDQAALGANRDRRKGAVL